MGKTIITTKHEDFNNLSTILEEDNNNNSTNHIIISKVIFITFGILLSLTILSALASVNTRVSADDTQSATASVNVSAACTMSATGTMHSATLTPGTFTGEIGTSNVNATCNDPGGFAVYAIGFSNDTYGNTNLINNADINNPINIPTSTVTSGDTSGWSMKLGNGTGDSVSIVNPYNNYSSVPEEYTKVATYTNGTTTGQAGTSFTTTYGVYISPTQTPGTYAGAVRYTLVHPNNAIPQSTYYMQDFTLSMCEVLAHDTPIEVVDRRDNEHYLVQYLKDGNCWMLDNLRLGSNEEAIELSPLDTNIKEPWVLPKGVTEIFNSYTEARINAAYKYDTDVTSYGLGSGKIGIYYNYCAASGGTYCHASNAGIDIPNTNIDSPYDICPLGWRMPTGGPNSEFKVLYNQFSSQVASDTTSLQYNLSTPLAGGLFSQPTPGNFNSAGYLWSSTLSAAYRSSMYELRVSNTTAMYDDNTVRTRGYSVRCLANS